MKIGMSNTDMLKHIMDEIRHMRSRLDDHIDDQNSHYRCVQKDMSKIREEMAGHKIKLSGITAGIAVFVTALVHWLFGGFK